MLGKIFFLKRSRRAWLDLRSQASARVPHPVLWDQVYATEKPVFGCTSHSQKTVPLSEQDTFRIEQVITEAD